MLFFAKIPRQIRLHIFALACAFCGIATNAQAQKLRLDYNSIDASAFPRIVSMVTVTNDSGFTVGALDTSHFVVHEDGVREYPIEVVELVDENVPVTVVLVIDKSSSMDEFNLMEDTKAAAITFVNIMGPNDKTGVVSFASKIFTEHDVSADKPSIISAINAIEAKGGTSLYDGIMRATNVIRPHLRPDESAALIVMTDGEDKEDSEASFNEALNASRALGIPVFTITLFKEGGFIGRDMKTLAAETGGLHFHSPTSKDLEEIYRRLSALLKHRYRVSYTTHNPARDGTLRLVQIDVNAFNATAFDTAYYRAPLDLVTVSPTTQDIPAPDRSFEIEIVIPPLSNPVFEMKDLTFVLTYDPQWLSVPNLDPALLSGALFGAPNSHAIQYVVDQAHGEIRFTLSKNQIDDLISGRGQLVRAVFQTSPDLPDNIPLTFTLQNLELRNGEGNIIPSEATTLTVNTFGYITAALTTNQELNPGREFCLFLEIPPHSKAVPEMRDFAFVVKYDPSFLTLRPAQNGAFQPGALFQPSGSFSAQFNPDAQGGGLQGSLTKNEGAALVQGRGEIAKITFDVSPDLPDSSLLKFEFISASGHDGNAWPLPFRTEDLTIVSNGLTVWPGDTDHNGVVELIDVLPLGVHWELNGPGRPNEPDPMLWKAQLTQRYPVKKAAHADADGSGGVNEQDIVPVGVNWGKTQGQAAAKPSQKGVQLPSGYLLATLEESNVQGRVNLSLRYFSENDAPISGATFKLNLQGSGAAFVRALAGNDWQNNPLLIAREFSGDKKIGVGVVALAGRSLAKKNGEIVQISLKSEQSDLLNKLVFEDVNLVAANGALIVSRVEKTQVAEAIPQTFSLSDAYPNPFNPVTNLRFSLPEIADVRVKIIDALGRAVFEYRLNNASAGYHSWQWQGRNSAGENVVSGVYFALFSAKSASGETWQAMRRMSLVK